MSNVISYPLPPINAPFLTSANTVAMPYYQSMLSLQNRTGGATGIDSSVVQATANAAALTASKAQTTALAAAATAAGGVEAAAVAQTTANNALTLAQALSVTALIKADVVIPLNLTWQLNCTGLVQIYFPIVSYLTFPANCFGTQFWCGSKATTPVGFTINYQRGGGSVQINTFTLAAGVNTGISGFSPSATVALVPGDVLWIGTTTTDATLANFSITIPMVLT